MEKEKRLVAPSYVGPLAEVESWADDFISGMIYCSLLEQMVEKQTAVGAVMASSDVGSRSWVAASEEDEDLEKVWMTLWETYRYEA